MNILPAGHARFDFSGRTLLLTGAGGGIGRATAKLFHEAGANLLIADLQSEVLKGLTTTLAPQKDRVVALPYDASRWEDSAMLVKSCLQHFGRIDFLVPAAAIYEDQPITTMTNEQWRRTMSVNVDSVFYLCRDAIPAMKDGSSIVNLSSDAAHQGSNSGHAHYGTSKGAVLGLTRSLARELAPRIRVNAVSPGVIDTPMIAQVMRARGKEILGAVPMKRMGNPLEVANVIAFLCSDAASYMTGETVQINGGSYIGG